MTDELNGKVLKEVVCLRSKLYSIDYVGGTKQSAKGVQKSVKKPYTMTCSRNASFPNQHYVKKWRNLDRFAIKLWLTL